MVKSNIFQKKYLLVYIKKQWFQELDPRCDAIASPSLIFINYPSPPLVIIPGRQLPARDKVFLSILEHEIVHVNQAILGKFPAEPGKGHFGNLIADLIDFTRAEYEANIIQHVKLPDGVLWPKEEVSLEEWCICPVPHTLTDFKG